MCVALSMVVGRFIRGCHYSGFKQRVSYIVELDPAISLGYVLSILVLFLGIAVSVYMNSRRRGG